MGFLWFLLFIYTCEVALTRGGTLECKKDELVCENGKCIKGKFRCDGDDDCGDGTDEHGCAKIRCPYNSQFRCSYRGRCISKSWVCNGARDCADGSDEASQLCKKTEIISKITSTTSTTRVKSAVASHSKTKPTEQLASTTSATSDARLDDTPYPANGKIECKKDELVCGKGKCIKGKFRCDGDDDCGDGTDEHGCAKIRCPYSHQFRCGYRGRCIPRSWMCNGVRNCADGSDEAAKLCKAPFNIPKKATDKLPISSSPSSTRKPTSVPGNCSVTAFRCGEADVCIDQSLVCDGNRDCPNNQDELNECDIGLRSRKPSNTQLIVGLLAGASCILLLIVVISVILCKCRKNHPNSTILLSGEEEGLTCEAHMFTLDDNYKEKVASFDSCNSISADDIAC